MHAVVCGMEAGAPEIAAPRGLATPPRDRSEEPSRGARTRQLACTSRLVSRIDYRVLSVLAGKSGQLLCSINLRRRDMALLLALLLLLLAAPIGGAAAEPIPLERHGVMAWNVGPPTAFWWNKTQRMMLYEAARFCATNHTYWPPSTDGALQPYSLHSFFRIRDLLSGEVVGNVQGSECFAYGSAVVDPVLQRAWVFGSERDLCGGHNKTHSAACAPFWQGRTAESNGVRAWWSDDLVTWHTATEPALMYSSYPFNTDVTPVVNKTLLTRPDGSRAIVNSPVSEISPAAGVAEPLNFVLVSESGRVATHTGPDRNLSTGWVHLSGENHKASRGFGACPAIHYGERARPDLPAVATLCSLHVP